MLDSALFRRHLEEDERATMIAHKHWLIGIKGLVLPTVSLLLSLAFLSAARAQAAFYVIAFWSLASVVWWVREFLDYYLDVWIITDQGIIDLEWHGWFHRQASRILYSDIQGVSYEVKGITGTILRYGDVSVEKISTGANIELMQVPHPRTVETLILRNMEAYLHKKNLKDATHVQDLLSHIVAEEMQARALQKDGKNEERRTISHAEDDGADVPKPKPRKKSFHTAKIGSRR